jgi:hypothetical protein
MSRYSKLAVALIPVILAALKVTADALGSEAGVDPQEWIAVAVAALTAVGVWAVPNKPPAGQAADPNISEMER